MRKKCEVLRQTQTQDLVQARIRTRGRVQAQTQMHTQRRMQIWAAGFLVLLFLASIQPQTVKGEVQAVNSSRKEAVGPGKLLEENSQTQIQNAGEEQAKEESASENGAEVLAEGWYPYGDGWYYIQADGNMAVDQCTPDGYYVNAQGIWKQETIQILSQKIIAPERFLTAQQMGEWKTLLPSLEELNKEIQNSLSGKRVFHVYADAVSYQKKDETGEETELLRLEKNEKTGGYFLRIRADLGNGSRKLDRITAYDYEVFYFLLTQISSTPTRLAEAIYGSWQKDNPWQLSRTKETAVGDARIYYDVEQGCGIYCINPAS